MKLPFRSEEPNDEDDFTNRWLDALGIEKNEPTPVANESVSFTEFIKAMERMASMTEGIPATPRSQPDANDLVAKIKESEFAGKITKIQGENPCCDMDANDGMIFVTPNKRGVRKIAAMMPEKASRAYVSIYAFDEHIGDYTALNMEAEGLKRLMNALPGIIAEAERMRDIAVELVADDEND